jgi:WD40 repeat protein
VLAVAFAPGGGWLVTGGADHTARVWDAATGAERAVLRGHTGPVAAVAVSPDGSRIATGGFDGAVRLWDAGRQTEVLAITDWAGWAVRCLAFSPDGGKLAAGGTWGATVYSRSPVELPLFPPVPPRPIPSAAPPKEMPKPTPPAAVPLRTG